MTLRAPVPGNTAPSYTIFAGAGAGSSGFQRRSGLVTYIPWAVFLDFAASFHPKGSAPRLDALGAHVVGARPGVLRPDRQKNNVVVGVVAQRV
ncbi:MAG: hypothetical protein ACR2IK_23000 [Chloroflexota bacterium]